MTKKSRFFPNTMTYKSRSARRRGEGGRSSVRLLLGTGSRWERKPLVGSQPDYFSVCKTRFELSPASELASCHWPSDPAVHTPQPRMQILGSFSPRPKVSTVRDRSNSPFFQSSCASGRGWLITVRRHDNAISAFTSPSDTRPFRSSGEHLRCVVVVVVRTPVLL